MSAFRIGRLLLVLACAFVLLDVVAVVGFGAGRHPPASPAARGPAPLSEGVAVDKPLGSLRLIDEAGHATSLSAFRGRYVVLAPSLTLCHEVCPLTTGALMRLRDELRDAGVGNRVVIAEATVDPWRDSPARVRAFLRRTGADVRFLTGSKGEISRLWKTLGVGYQRVPQDDPPDVDWMTGRRETFDVQHTDGVFVVDPAGHLRVAVVGMPQVGTLPARLSALLNDEGRQNLRAPKGPWTADGLRDDVLHLMGRPAPKTAAVTPPTVAQARAALAGSPGPLATLHSQAGALLPNDGDAFARRVAALRGHPVVVNEWASWCPPCRQELPLFAAAAARFGRDVAFVGLNVNDGASGAHKLLGTVALSYPSYADDHGRAADHLATVVGLPTTVFLDATGKVVATHPGEYRDAQQLFADIRAHSSG